MNFDLYRGKRVFVTGHMGFKGRHLVRKLEELGAKIRGFDNAPPSGHDWGDVRNVLHLIDIVRGFHPDFIFHLAAQAFVPIGFEDPLITWETNAQGTVNLLEAIRFSKLDLCAVVIVTTDKVYGPYLPTSPHWAGSSGFLEIDPLTPHCPYSASKVAAEHAVAAYRDAYWRDGRIDVATARAGNVIGPGDFGTGRLIPNAVRALKRGDPAPCYNPDAVRPWQHVEDVIDGYLRLGAALYRDIGNLPNTLASAWNFGPDEHHTVREVLDLVCNEWSDYAVWNGVPCLLHEVSELRIDSMKARRLLDWKPKWTFEAMIIETIKWYKEQP